MAAPRIVTSHFHGPNNLRTGKPQVAWQAWDDRLGADASPTGFGWSEEEAIANFHIAIEESAQ